MTTAHPSAGPAHEESLIGGLLESLARLPLRLLEFVLGLLALAGVAGYASVTAISVGSILGPVTDYTRWVAVTFGVAAVLAFLSGRTGERFWSRSVLHASPYLRHALGAAMLWQLVTAVFILRSLGPWLQMANSMVDLSSAASDFGRGGIGSGLAAFLLVAVYVGPGVVVLAAAAPVAVALGVIPAALRGSRILVRLLITGAVLQTAYWGGAVLTLDVMHVLIGPALQEVGAPPPMRPSLRVLELDPARDRNLIRYLREHEKTGRPAVRQLGWLLLAPWIFVPLGIVKRRTKSVDPGGAIN